MSRSPISSARTLDQVASAAGVSKMTVSRVLRHPEQVSEKTREKVLACIEKLSYRPNPLISTLMAATRQRRASATSAGIAFVLSLPREAVEHYEVAQRIYVGAKDRAMKKGYELMLHSLADEKLPLANLSTILKARGIEGIIFGPLRKEHSHLPIRLNGLAVAACGFSLVDPMVHRVATNQRELASQAYLVARNRGYRRIGVAIGGNLLDNVGLQWLSAIAAHHEADAQHIPPLIHRAQDKAAFHRWFQQWEPDCVIANSLKHFNWLKKHGRNIPEEIGFLLLGMLRGEEHLSGLLKNYEGIGAAAVDLIAQQLHDNERGVPSYRKTILLDPQWNEGCTLRPAR